MISLMSKPKGTKQDPTNAPCELVQTPVEAANVVLLRGQCGPMCSAATCLRIMRGNYSSTPHWYSLFLTSDNMSHNVQACGQL